jgi:hypothetical protein
VHRLEWIARKKLLPSTAQWDRGWQLYAEAAEEFRRNVRAELGIPGSSLPLGDWAQPALPAAGEGARA